MMFVEVEAGSSERAVSRWGFALPLVPITLSVFCLSALVYYQVQRGGAEPAQGLLQGLVVGLHGLIGFVPAFLFCLMVLTWSSIWFFNGTLERPGARVGRLAAFALSLAILVNLGEGALAAVPPGGAIGEFLAVRFESVLGTGLSTLLVSVAAIASLLLATDYFFYRYFEPLGRPHRSADLRDETGTEAEAAELLSTLPVPDLGALAARRRAAAAIEPVDVDIVTGDEAAVAIADDDADDDAGESGGSWRARRRVQRHLRIDDAEAQVEVGAEAQVEVVDEASDPEESEVWEDEEEAVAARGALDDDQGWEEDDDEPADDDEDEADEAEDEDVDWEEADYEDDYDDDEDEDEDEDDEDEDDEDDEDEDDDYDEDEDEDEEEDEEEDDYEDDDFRGFEDEDEDERAEAGTAEPAVAGIVAPETTDSKSDESSDAGPSASADEEKPYEIPRPEAGGRGRQKSLFAAADAEVDEHLLDEAARTVIRAHRASVTLLQRRMRVDFQEARALMEDLRRQGVVGGEEGEAHAPVLIDMAAWDAR